MKEFDIISKPRHYTTDPSGIECIEITESMGFCDGNCFKYLFRYGLKDDPVRELKKALYYAKKCNEYNTEVESVNDLIMEVARYRDKDKSVRRAMEAIARSDWDYVVNSLNQEIERLVKNRRRLFACVTKNL